MGGRRIICVGNRYVPRDAAGPHVLEHLARCELPEGVELIDGGLAGLDLLRFVDGAERVVFVDALDTEDQAAGVQVTSPAELSGAAPPAYGHGAGLAYLLAVLPEVCDRPLPPVHVVGVAGPAGARVIRDAADTALRLVQQSAPAARRSSPGCG